MENKPIIDTAITAANVISREAAKKLLDSILREDRTNSRAWYLLSQVTERPEEAKAYLKKVLEIDPQNSQASEMLKRISG
jgi:cytochrome c-type biogenesis protein CcmH/NrfG